MRRPEPYQKRNGAWMDPITDARGRLIGWNERAPAPRVHARAELQSTEQQAADRIRPAVGSLRALVLELVEGSTQGMTADDVVARLEQTSGVGSVNPYSIRPRLTELARVGLIRDSGRRRENRGGSREIVWTTNRPGENDATE